MEDNNNQKTKGINWRGFSIGLLVGLAIAISFYFADKYWLKDPVHLLTPIVEKETTPPDTVYIVNNNYYSKKNSNGKTASTNSIVSDSSSTDYPEFTIDDSEFEDADDAVINKDEGIANRTIHVSVLNDESDSVVTPPIPIFEVEQWSSAIKNKFVYQRTGNSLKIKGMNINNIRIIYADKKYYIEFNHHYYLIRNNNDFERLQPIMLNQ